MRDGAVLKLESLLFPLSCSHWHHCHGPTHPSPAGRHANDHTIILPLSRLIDHCGSQMESLLLLLHESLWRSGDRSLVLWTDAWRAPMLDFGNQYNLEGINNLQPGMHSQPYPVPHRRAPLPTAFSTHPTDAQMQQKKLRIASTCAARSFSCALSHFQVYTNYL
ncbi:hypothetical protein B0T22DRAFT_149467 [Podospora appendiculata]|uniref:Uncharacterized protein n=1 Tax=Podospora appendiculata TaxID=314037 RepID=A0AAE0X9G2_9PEZI|nr:hypothetical protein B0T22DRAFT_149467 [Podospora appendiculata]